MITGSTRGIGLGLAREFLVRGHRVVINGRDPETLRFIVADFGNGATLWREWPAMCEPRACIHRSVG
ncbi:MAG: hypothetical protein R2751_10240 [Bacteroidales bacterium]